VEPATSTISVSVWPTGANWERAIEEVIAAGGALLERGEHQPGSPYAYVTAPDGHVIEL
jgi:hypothetical protein